MELGDLCRQYAEYRLTNESPEAVMAGLIVSGGDRIFSVCGSGDQVFAMIEYAEYIMAIDKDKLQVDYARKIKQLIKRQIRAVRKSLKSNKNIDSNAGYFLDGDRLRTIKKRLSRLHISKGDIYALPEQGRFSKAYLSNAIRYSSYPSSEEIFAYLSSLGSRLENPGLIYLSQYYPLECKIPSTRAITTEYDTVLSEPMGLVIDKRLTKKAASLEYERGMWHPVVLRKS